MAENTGNVYADYKPPETTGQYFKFENGVTYRLRLLSEPVAFESIFTNKDDPSDTSVSTKFAWLTYDTEKEEVVILQLPTTVYKQIAALGVDPEYGDPTKYDIKMTRTGTGPKTQYTLVPGANKNAYAEVYPKAVEGFMATDLIETLSKSDRNRNVNWVRDLVGKPVQKSEFAPITSAAGFKADDAPEEEEKPIDLSEIPF